MYLCEMYVLCMCVRECVHVNVCVHMFVCVVMGGDGSSDGPGIALESGQTVGLGSSCLTINSHF